MIKFSFNSNVPTHVSVLSRISNNDIFSMIIIDNYRDAADYPLVNSSISARVILWYYFYCFITSCNEKRNEREEENQQ